MSSKRELVEYQLDDNTTVLIESQVDKSKADGLVSEADKKISKSTQRFDTLLGQIRPTIEALHNSLTDINNPAEINLEVGLDLKLGAGVVFASAESNCAFKVSFKWVNPQSS